MGLGTMSKGVKPSSSLKMLEKAQGWKALRSFLVGELSYVGASTSACLVGVLLPPVFDNFEWVREEFLVSLRNGDLGSSRSASTRVKVEDNVIYSGLGTSVVGKSSLNSPVKGFDCMGCPRVAEVSPAMVGGGG